MKHWITYNRAKPKTHHGVRRKIVRLFRLTPFSYERIGKMAGKVKRQYVHATLIKKIPKDELKKRTKEREKEWEEYKKERAIFTCEWCHKICTVLPNTYFCSAKCKFRYEKTLQSPEGHRDKLQRKYCLKYAKIHKERVHKVAKVGRQKKRIKDYEERLKDEFGEPVI